MAKCQICSTSVRKTVNLPVRGVFGDSGRPEEVAVCRKCAEQWACPGCGKSLYGYEGGRQMCPECWFENRQPKPARRGMVFVALFMMFAFTVGCAMFYSHSMRRLATADATIFQR
jgi:hypothetical protein